MPSRSEKRSWPYAPPAAAFAPSDKLAITVGYLGGPEQNDVVVTPADPTTTPPTPATPAAVSGANGRLRHLADVVVDFRPTDPLRGLVFDSHYDQYKGVVTYVRLAAGTLHEHERIRLMGSGAEAGVRPRPGLHHQSANHGRWGPISRSAEHQQDQPRKNTCDDG